MKNWQASVTLATVLLTSVTSAQQSARVDVEVQLKAALQKELVDGDLKGAIEMYKTIVANAGANRTVAAKALLAMGQSYEKLGNAEARNAYDRLVRDYADQRDVAAQGRARLAALGDATPRTKATGLTTRQVWAQPNTDVQGGVSFDGRYLSYVDHETGDLAIRDLGTRENRRLTSTGSSSGGDEFAEISTFSPDARQIVYAWSNKDGFYELRLVGRDGGQPRVLSRNEDVRYLQPFDWSPDGKHIAAVFSGRSRTNQIVLVSVADGSVRVLKTLDWRFPGKMAFSPDGRLLAYDFPPLDDAAERDLFVLATDGSREVPLVKHPANDFLLGWFPEGDRVLFASDRSGTNGAWAIRVADGKPQGEAELLKPDIGGMTGIGFTKSGEYYYGQTADMPDVYIATLDSATGRVVDGPAPIRVRYAEQKLSAAYSADGEQLAYLVQRPPSWRLSFTSMSILTLKTGQVRDIPLKVSYAFRLSWMPDGRSLLVGAIDLKGRSGVFRLDLSTGDIQPIVPGATIATVSPDGGTLFYEIGPSGPAVVMRDLGTGQENVIYPHAAATIAVSPDGRWLALQGPIPSADGKPASRAIVLVPKSGGEPRVLWRLDSTEASGHNRLAWSRDSKFVLSVGAGDELWREPVDGGTPQKLGVTVPGVTRLSMHPDGRRLAISAGSRKVEVWAMENFLPKAGSPIRPK
jgi:Tol biopolymer transport system component